MFFFRFFLFMNFNPPNLTTRHKEEQIRRTRFQVQVAMINRRDHRSNKQHIRRQYRNFVLEGHPANAGNLRLKHFLATRTHFLLQSSILNDLTQFTGAYDLWYPAETVPELPVLLTQDIY